MLSYEGAAPPGVEPGSSASKAQRVYQFPYGAAGLGGVEPPTARLTAGCYCQIELQAIDATLSVADFAVAVGGSFDDFSTLNSGTAITEVLTHGFAA